MPIPPTFFPRRQALEKFSYFWSLRKNMMRIFINTLYFHLKKLVLKRFLASLHFFGG